MTGHDCPTRNCSITVPAHIFMCARHWRMVPRPLQIAIYEDYQRTKKRGANHEEAIRVVNECEAGRADLDLPAGTKALTVWQPWATPFSILSLRRFLSGTSAKNGTRKTFPRSGNLSTGHQRGSQILGWSLSRSRCTIRISKSSKKLLNPEN
jgi:hypothetical protein